MNASKVFFSIAVVSLLGGCSAFGGDSVDRHPDDEVHGALTVMPGAGSGTLDVPGYVDEGESWSGMFGSHTPCLNDKDVPVTITGVTWKTDGSTEPISVTAYTRTFDNRENDWIGSALGTPSDPEIPERFESVDMREGVRGLEVTKPCGDDSTRWVEGVEQEILFVIKAGPEGAGIRNVSVSYVTPDGARHASVSDWRFYLCGSNVPKKYGCD